MFFQESITITLLAGIPNYLLDRLKNPQKKNQNNTECIVFKSTKHCHVSPFLHSLHRLPITRRIDYKLSSLCFSVNNGTGSKYLSELLTIYTPSRQLRSASDTGLFRFLPSRQRQMDRDLFHFQMLLSGTIFFKLSDILHLSPHSSLL